MAKSTSSQSIIKRETLALSIPKITCLFGVASLELARQMLNARRDNPLLGYEELNSYAQFEIRLQKLTQAGNSTLRSPKAYLKSALQEILQLHQTCEGLVSEFAPRFKRHQSDSEFIATSFAKKVADSIDQQGIVPFPQHGKHPVDSLRESASDLVKRVNRGQGLVHDFRASWDALMREFSNPFRVVKEQNEFVLPSDYHDDTPLQNVLAFFISVVRNTPQSEFHETDQNLLKKVCDASENLSELACRLTRWFAITCLQIEEQAVLKESLEKIMAYAGEVYSEELRGVLGQANIAWLRSDGGKGFLKQGGASVPKPYVSVPDCNFAEAIASEDDVRDRISEVAKSELIAVMQSAETRLRELAVQYSLEKSDEMGKGRRISTAIKQGFLSRSRTELNKLRFEDAINLVRNTLCQQEKISTEIHLHLDSAESVYHSHRTKAKSSLLGLAKDWLGLEIDDESPIRNHLEVASTLVANSGWSMKSDAYATLRQRASSINEISEYCGVVLIWNPLSNKPRFDASLRPRDLPSVEIFVNVLCSVAAADRTFCGEEKKAIVAILLKYRICDRKQALEIITKWMAHARKIGMVDCMSQSIRDVEELRNRDDLFCRALPNAMRLVGEADGIIDDSEKQVYREVKKVLGS